MQRALLTLSFVISGALVSSLFAADPAASWKATSSLSAPEATQAAAVGAEHVYAIDNTRVARYDRKTGKRVDVSTGAATHLNSGFWRDGKLYCAHSNYPKTPEQSEIKVLDPATMKLTTFHDFGNFGGSLTWCVWHDDHWWCNFAKYGQQNAATFLVRFDDQWREQARWTWPRAVIERLGAYSLSGGVWLDDELLATGHDDRVLFRLRLPKAGSELEFIGEEKTPFPGQGIALDPAGGLVGIDRGKKLVVFAKKEE
jgi:hypothetical protein